MRERDSDADADANTNANAHSHSTLDRLNATAAYAFEFLPLNFRRSIAPRILISLLAVWTASSWLRPGAYAGAQLSTLGKDIAPGNVYGHDPRKLAIIFEPRHVPHLAHLLVHTGNVLPLDWPLLYVGTRDSIARVNESYPVQSAQERGRLMMQEAPDWVNFEDEDLLKNVFGTPDFYNALPASVEWLLMVGSDSILCSLSLLTMNDWLQYDWLGSPWASNSWQGGTNGFSLRRVSKVKKALRKLRRQTDTVDDAQLMDTIITRPGAQVPSAERAELFVMESAWAERPMAYHPAQRLLAEEEGWSQKHLRAGIFDHCAEVKIIMEMKLSREKCPDPPQVMTPNEKRMRAQVEQMRMQAEHDKVVAAEARWQAEQAQKWSDEEAAQMAATEGKQGQKKHADHVKPDDGPGVARPPPPKSPLKQQQSNQAPAAGPQKSSHKLESESESRSDPRQGLAVTSKNKHLTNKEDDKAIAAAATEPEPQDGKANDRTGGEAEDEDNEETTDARQSSSEKHTESDVSDDPSDEERRPSEDVDWSGKASQDDSEDWPATHENKGRQDATDEFKTGTDSAEEDEHESDEHSTEAATDDHSPHDQEARSKSRHLESHKLSAKGKDARGQAQKESPDRADEDDVKGRSPKLEFPS